MMLTHRCVIFAASINIYKQMYYVCKSAINRGQRKNIISIIYQMFKYVCGEHGKGLKFCYQYCIIRYMCGKCNYKYCKNSVDKFNEICNKF